MNAKILISILTLGLLIVTPASAQKKDQETISFGSLQKNLQPDKVITYKKVGNRELTLHFFYPEGYKPSDKRTAFVAIHGGGWRSGTPRRFYPYANALVDKGYVGISVEYRLLSKATNVFDCVKDGRAALRYIRKHAEELGIDPDQIVVCGGSAGAHVAAGTSLFDGIDHEDEDIKVSCTPNAMVLLFPVIDTSAEGYGQKLIGDKWETISPVHQVKKGVPPTLIFHGDEDKTTPYMGAKRFTDRMQEEGNLCELVTHPGGGHGHINSSMKLFDDAMQRTDEFIRKNLNKD